MQKSKIEWTDYTINPVRGLCPMACPYCYARRMYKRFKWHEQIEYVQDWWTRLAKIKKPSHIFVGSTMELFGTWIPEETIKHIFEKVRLYPQHTFIFLTKQPQNLIKWSPFPDNAWVGVSATNNDMAWAGSSWLRHIEAGIKFISFEPLLEPMHSKDGKLDYTRAIVEQLDWLIIGQQTPIKVATTPKTEWIREIVEAADRAGAPVFLKNNLQLLFDKVNKDDARWAWDMKRANLRQEMPK